MTNDKDAEVFKKTLKKLQKDNKFNKQQQKDRDSDDYLNSFSEDLKIAIKKKLKI
jgi:hypothetical protein